jgi:hypothetical protein
VHDVSPNATPFSDLTSGIIGLGLTGPNLSFEDTIFGGFFRRNPNATQFRYGMSLMNPNAPESISQGGAGAIDWLAEDTTAFQGEPVWSNVKAGTPASGGAALSGSSDMVIRIDGWSFESGPKSMSNSAGGDAVIETFIPDIYLPKAEAEDICKQTIPRSDCGLRSFALL